MEGVNPVRLGESSENIAHDSVFLPRCLESRRRASKLARRLGLGAGLALVSSLEFALHLETMLLPLLQPDGVAGGDRLGSRTRRLRSAASEEKAIGPSLTGLAPPLAHRWPAGGWRSAPCGAPPRG